MNYLYYEKEHRVERIRDFQPTERISINNIAHTPKVPLSPEESGFKFMKRLSETPFINISAENLDAASDMLDRNQKGELLEMIIEAVRNDGAPTTEDRYVRGVFNQFMAVIERKARGYAQRQEALDKVNEAKKKKPEPEVSVNTPKEIIEEEKTPIPMIEIDEREVVPISGSRESKRDKCINEWFRSLQEDPKREERMRVEYKDYFLTLTQAKRSYQEVYG